MIKASFYIPEYYNSGQPVPEAVMRTIQDELIVNYGGFTLAGTVRGAWVDKDGTVYHDTSLKFELAIESAALPGLRDYLKQLKARIDQEAIYLEVNDQVNIEFL